MHHNNAIPMEDAGPLQSWPYEGEIAQAIEFSGESNFALDGKPIDFADLVVRLSNWSGEKDMIRLLEQYPYDYDWINDLDFVTRYVVGAFHSRYEDLNVYGLQRLLEFAGVGHVDYDILERVVTKYSGYEEGYHFPYSKVKEMVQDWFTGELQFTGLNMTVEAIEALEEKSWSLQEEIEKLKMAILN